MSKIVSLGEMINEIDADVTIVTETWLKGEENEQDIVDFEQRTGFNFIRRDRNTGRRGGGVAVIRKR